MKMEEYSIVEALKQTEVFTRSDVYETLKKLRENISEAIANHTLQQMLNDGCIVRVGRNKYSVANTDYKKYNYSYSKMAEKVAKEISKNHPYLDFRLFELVQLNEFVNHLIAHNVVFVFVENDLGDFVFSTLRNLFPGKVLINPDADTYHNYVADNSIVIERLISESPKGIETEWHSRIEKILVDLLTDRCIAEAVNEGELVNIYEGAFDKYVIDEDTMFRYARRRGAEKKVKTFIKTANIKLRTV